MSHSKAVLLKRRYADNTRRNLGIVSFSNSILEMLTALLNCSQCVQTYRKTCTKCAPQYFKIYRTIILPVVLYACKTWSLTLREERRLMVFENRVLRRIFGTRRDGVKQESGENYITRS